MELHVTEPQPSRRIVCVGIQPCGMSSRKGVPEIFDADLPSVGFRPAGFHEPESWWLDVSCIDYLTPSLRQICSHQSLGRPFIYIFVNVPMLLTIFLNDHGALRSYSWTIQDDSFNRAETASPFRKYDTPPYKMNHLKAPDLERRALNFGPRSM